jgi:hypothetical protein
MWRRSGLGVGFERLFSRRIPQNHYPAPAVVNLDSSVSGWYFGNLAFGGVIGMLIVDPLTGAMFNLTPDKIDQPLTSSQTQVIRQGKGVLVVMVSQTTEQERANMVRVN